MYDAAYVAARYDRYPTTRKMSELRLSVLHTALRLYESLPGGYSGVAKGRLLDVGYGNGDFIRVAAQGGWDAYGHDVNPTEYEGVRRVKLPNEPDWPLRYRVITFFDCLEHYEDLCHVRWVSHAAEWILLSFPVVPETFPFVKEFKHYRPGEHHLFFQPQSLEKIFSYNSRKAALVYQGYPEDTIRKPVNDNPNIWTCLLHCQSTE
jgi:hypothetical protein